MKLKIKSVLAMLCAIIMVALCGCSDVTEGFEALTTNTTVDEAMTDIAELNNAIAKAKIMVQNKDTSVYGDLALSDTVSFKDVVTENALEEQAKTKRIDGVSYYLYWDNTTGYPFWSTDGTDDIRNSQEGAIAITHSDSTEIKNKTNVTSLQ